MDVSNASRGVVVHQVRFNIQMKRTLFLLLAVLTLESRAELSVICMANGNPDPEESVDVQILYPKKGQTLYEVQVAGWDEKTSKEVILARYQGVGKLDRRMLDGKLTLLYPGTQDEAGKIWFVEPEDQDIDPKSGEVIGRERKMQTGNGTPFELEDCFLFRDRP